MRVFFVHHCVATPRLAIDAPEEYTSEARLVSGDDTRLIAGSGERQECVFVECTLCDHLKFMPWPVFRHSELRETFVPSNRLKVQSS